MKRVILRCLRRWARHDRLTDALWIDSVTLLLLVPIAFAARSADALIIDIDATLNNISNPLQISLAAGTYAVTPVGIAGGGVYDAWNPWGTSTCGTPSGCAQTVPTTVVGWKNSYDVISDAITAVSVSGSPLSPISTDPTDTTSNQDYWVSNGSEPDRYHIDDSTVYPSAADAFAGAKSSVFTVSAGGLVGFAIRDSSLSDNFGGMSLEINPIPEPSTAALLGLGLLSLAGWRRARAS